MLLPEEPVMQTLFRQLVPICIVMAIPIIPFLIMGDVIGQWVADFENSTWLAGIVIMLLSGDIFLPIPSSVVSTFVGGQMHWLTGTLISWIGMTNGALLGFGLLVSMDVVLLLNFPNRRIWSVLPE